MEYTTDEAAKNMHEVYLRCKSVFDPNHLMVNNRVDFENEEEEFFCKIVGDFFLQRKQTEIVRQKKHGK